MIALIPLQLLENAQDESNEQALAEQAVLIATSKMKLIRVKLSVSSFSGSVILCKR